MTDVMPSSGRSDEIGVRERAWREWGGLERCEAWQPPTVHRGTATALVVAPHPDDETLAVGGTMQRLADAGWDLTVVVVTDGEASHPDWADGGAQGLAATRRDEFARAMRRLGVGPRRIEHLGLPDSAVADHADALAAGLAPHVQRASLVLAPHPQDGHPDHDVTGRVALELARSHGVTAAAYGVWLWAWSLPGEVRYPWAEAVLVELDEQERERKRAAIAIYRSQLEAGPGEQPILPPDVVDHHLREVELLFVLNGVLP